MSGLQVWNHHEVGIASNQLWFHEMSYSFFFYGVSVAFWFFVRFSNILWDVFASGGWFRCWEITELYYEWWFQIFCICTRKIGEDFQCDSCFSIGWKPPTSIELGRVIITCLKICQPKNGWFGPGGRFEPIVLNGETKTTPINGRKFNG